MAQNISDEGLRELLRLKKKLEDNVREHKLLICKCCGYKGELVSQEGRCPICIKNDIFTQKDYDQLWEAP